MISLIVLLEPGLLQRMIPFLDPKVPIFVVVLLLTVLTASLLGGVLLYCGGVHIATYRGIRAGRPWAIAVSAATVLLFCLYLTLLLPLGPDSGPRISLGMWTLYLIWLAVARARGVALAG